MEKPDRTREENDALHETHASADPANAVAGDADAATRHEARVRQRGKQIAEGDDRKRLSEELQTLPR
jgi:hypothetical protein